MDAGQDVVSEAPFARPYNSWCRLQMTAPSVDLDTPEEAWARSFNG